MEISFKKTIKVESSDLNFVIHYKLDILFVVGGIDTIYAYNLNSSDLLYEINCRENLSIIECIAISTCQNFLLVGYSGGNILLIEISTRLVKKKFISENNSYFRIEYILCCENNKFFSCSSNKSIKHWDISTGECIASFQVKDVKLFDYDHAICLLYDTDKLYYSTLKGYIAWIDINTRETKIVKGHSNSIWDIYKINDNFIASNCKLECNIKIWEKKDLSCKRTFSEYNNTSFVNCLESNVSPDGCYIIGEIYEENKTINTILKIWDIKTGECVSNNTFTNEKLPLRALLPNEHGDWLSMRSDIFETFIPLEAEKKYDTSTI